ncbi:hypothetical protein [Spirosoma sp. KNUC1025]|uniref:hypothetical protein n=1 Tax=Spirosoma sp. KNUC1025 TaxID=2894082 RepID=UPI0038646A3E|nr:hypothetical protein LN737_27405 [Spirosoma sp. KNUC1025]
MVSQQEEVFSFRRKRNYLLWLLLLVLFAILVGIPTGLAISEFPYPDLGMVLFFFATVPMMWIAVLADFGPRASTIELRKADFLIQKVGQKVHQHTYSAILAYNERTVTSGRQFRELTVYLNNNWFVVRSNEFDDYDFIHDQLTQYGNPGPQQNVLTSTERNRFRWSIGWFALLISANIAFGYLAHDSADKKPAPVISVTAVVNRVSIQQTKYSFKGIDFQLQPWPDFTFYASRSSYATNIRPLKQAIALKRPVTLLIRKSEFRKKILKKEPLTFGDKFDRYAQIAVFGINQGNNVQLMTDKPIYEPTHTNPTQRTILLGMLLLCCWAGWVYVDRYKVLPSA